MKILFNCIILLLFTACSVSNGWQSNYAPGHINGAFAYLNGTQNLTISAPAGKSLLKYHLECSSGELQLIIKSPEKPIVNIKTSKEVSESILLNLNGDLKYKVALIGKRARGSYDIECVTQ